MPHKRPAVPPFPQHPPGRIKPYSCQHLGPVVCLFKAIQSASSGAYPPERILAFHYGTGEEGIVGWLGLGRDRETSRFLFVFKDTETVIGHIAITPLSGTLDADDLAYWREAFPMDEALGSERDGRPLQLSDLAIVKRLGVHPDWQGRGIGRQLFRYAVGWVAHVIGQVAGLVVLEDLLPAQALYESEGGRVVGHFKEATGESMVSYLFQRGASPSAP